METKRKKHFVDEDYDNKLEVENKNKHVCKHCGTAQIIPAHKKQIICKDCGHWVFRSDKDEYEYRKNEQKQEFKRRMKEQLNSKKSEE